VKEQNNTFQTTFQTTFILTMGTKGSTFEHTEFVHFDTPHPVISERYCHSSLKEYVIKENIFSLSGDSFEIKDENDVVAFKMIGKAFSLHNKKKLVDHEGKLVGKMNKKYFTMHGRTFIMDSQENVLACMKRRKFFEAHSAADIWILKNPLPLNDSNKKKIKEETKERVPDLLVDGNWRAKNMIIADSSGHCVVKIQRHNFNARNIIMGKDTYTLVVPPNADTAFAVMVTVTFDELFREHHNNSAIIVAATF